MADQTETTAKPGLRPRIQDLPSDDRPRERLAREGPAALSNPELLAILLRVGVAGENAIRVAERLLVEVTGLPGLHRAAYADLCALKGIGPAKAAQLMAAIELGRRIASSSPDERVTISSPADAANLLMYQMAALEQEYLFHSPLPRAGDALELRQRFDGVERKVGKRGGEMLLVRFAFEFLAPHLQRQPLLFCCREFRLCRAEAVGRRPEATAREQPGRGPARAQSAAACR